METSRIREPLALKIKRAARRFVWPRPTLYWPFGILRRKLNVFKDHHELYIAGYPRSGNTFAVKAFLSANPKARVRSHTHIPAFVVQSVGRNTPGMVLIRKPIDAATSWAIHERQTVQEALAYYTNYYRVLLPFRNSLFFVRFEEVTTDFGRVTSQFNIRWDTHFVPFEHTQANAAHVIEQIEAEEAHLDKDIRELRVCRPSVAREPMKSELLNQVEGSRTLQGELQRANELYQILAPQICSSSECQARAGAAQESDSRDSLSDQAPAIR